MSDPHLNECPVCHSVVTGDLEPSLDPMFERLLTGINKLDRRLRDMESKLDRVGSDVRNIESDVRRIRNG